MVEVDTVSAAIGAASVVFLCGAIYLIRARGTYSKLKKSKTFSPGNLIDCYLPNHANKMEWPGRRIYLHSEKKRDEICNAKITSLKEKLDRAESEEHEILEIYNPLVPQINETAGLLRSDLSKQEKRTVLTSKMVPLMKKRHKLDTQLASVLQRKDKIENELRFWKNAKELDTKEDVIDVMRQEYHTAEVDLGHWLQQNSIDMENLDDLLEEWQ